MKKIQDNHFEEVTIYNVDTWTKYIDEHILENLTVQSLAKTFCYSPTHFRHIFRLYYDMPVSDYIRKRKLQMAAEELKKGTKLIDVVAKYGFTSAGFTRAFQKEFNVTPTAYRKGTFEVLDLQQYYSEYKDYLKVSFVKVKELKMVGRSVLQGKGEDADIPAQVDYYLKNEFPVSENTRLVHNRERREDKIAMWYNDDDLINVEYVLGSVVDHFEEIQPDQYPITLAAGPYAIFETDKESDMENLPETIRMFSRCVLYGWIKENKDRVDLLKYTFERYIDKKVYLYVPLKEDK